MAPKTSRKAAAKPTAKKTAEKKTAAKPARRTAPKKTASPKKPAANTPRKAPAEKAATKTPAKKSAAKSTKSASTDNYTKPDLREKIKKDVIAGDKGGRAGQWSARKAQLVAHEYEAEGGGYKHPRTDAQKSLKSWGDEHWHTADGKQAIQGEETHRYLPDKAWNELSPAEKKATDKKKVAGSKQGRQFVPNTKEASRARRHATKE